MSGSFVLARYPVSHARFALYPTLDDMKLVLEAHSLGGSTMTESFFSVPAEKKQKNTGAIVGSAIAACFVAGIVCVFVWRRRQLGDYQPLT